MLPTEGFEANPHLYAHSIYNRSMQYQPPSFRPIFPHVRRHLEHLGARRARGASRTPTHRSQTDVSTQLFHSTGHSTPFTSGNGGIWSDLTGMGRNAAKGGEGGKRSGTREARGFLENRELTCKFLVSILSPTSRRHLLGRRVERCGGQQRRERARRGHARLLIEGSGRLHSICSYFLPLFFQAFGCHRELGKGGGRTRDAGRLLPRLWGRLRPFQDPS